MRHLFLAFLAVSFLILPMPARAQAVYGNIVGTVVDPSGAPIPQAKVTITDMQRDVSYTTTTNDSGNFSQRLLIVGKYRIRVEVQGFQIAVLEGVNVSVDQEARVDFALKVGDVTQAIEVSADASMLKTERGEVSQTFSQKVVTELPVFNRRFTNFELLTPGVQAFPGQTAMSEDPQGSYRKNVNGQSFAGTAHLLDGTDNHDAVLGLIVINPTLDSVGEAKVTTSNYDAEFGATAGVVSAQTKSGTNLYHGSAFWFIRNDHWMARNPFTQSRTIVGSTRLIPVVQWNQFGGSFSGPLVKNKIFDFMDFQGTRRNNGGSVLTRVPTAAEDRAT
jgi:hypothetical protein